MGGNLKDRWSVPATAVANEFIDEYMAGANGEYVKVYLYVLRHQGRRLTIDMIADGLNHTESDVARALSYWQRMGVLSEEKGRKNNLDGDRSLEVWSSKNPGGENASLKEAAATSGHVTLKPDEKKERAAVPFKRPVYTQEPVNRLAQDEEFAQLLYIAQKYTNLVFTPRDCQVFAYLYEELGMKGELLEYLVEYCVQNGHSSVRYIEAVALNWHEKEIKTVRDAKLHCASYSQDSFAVMKAFGINNRNPGLPEQKLMDKWFKDFSFSRELVVEACGRTIAAIHNPSFQYADKILSEWKLAGVKCLADVEALDVKRIAGKEEVRQSEDKQPFGQEGAKAASRQVKHPRKGAPNQFHNFEQRDTDYDALMVKQVKEWVERQS